MKHKTKIIDKYTVSFFIPVIFNPTQSQLIRREFDPFLTEDEAWKLIDSILEKEPEGSFGAVEPQTSRRIRVVVPDESGLIVPDEPGKLKVVKH